MAFTDTGRWGIKKFYVSLPQKICLSLCVLTIGFTLLLGARVYAVARKGSHPARSKQTLTYRVVELGRHHFLGQPLIPKDVAALLAHRRVGGFSFSDINTHGERISNQDGAPSRAYLSHGRTVRPLQPLPNLSQSAALGINNRGDIVGASWDDDQSYNAVLWRNGRVYNLNAHCFGAWAHLKGANLFGRGLAINNRGQIVVNYIENERNADYYLLTPVSSFPEPTRPHHLRRIYARRTGV